MVVQPLKEEGESQPPRLPTHTRLSLQAVTRSGGICFDHARGVCTRGDACRFSHDASAVAAHKASSGSPGGARSHQPASPSPQSSGTPHGEGSVAKRLSSGGSMGDAGGVKPAHAAQPSSAATSAASAALRAVPQPRPGGYAAAAGGSAHGVAQQQAQPQQQSAQHNPWQQAPAHMGMHGGGGYSSNGMTAVPYAAAAVAAAAAASSPGQLASDSHHGGHAMPPQALSYAHQLQSGLANGASPGKAHAAQGAGSLHSNGGMAQHGLEQHTPSTAAGLSYQQQQPHMMPPPPPGSYGAHHMMGAFGGYVNHSGLAPGAPLGDMASLRRDLPPYGGMHAAGHQLPPPPLPPGPPPAYAMAGYMGPPPLMAGGGLAYPGYDLTSLAPSYASPGMQGGAGSAHAAFASSSPRPVPGHGLGSFSSGGYSLFADANGGAQPAKGSPGGNGAAYGGLLF